MRGTDQPSAERAFTGAFALVVAIVALWGVGHRFYETLMPQFAAVFDLQGPRRILTESAYQIVYIFGALPAALIARRFGYKTSLLIGLGSICIGAFTFYPAAETQGFVYFLFATMLLAFGWILLEVSGNPLAMVFGNEATAVWRLNLVQTIYPIGSLLGIYAARWILHAGLALPKQGATYSLAHPYIVLGLAVLLLAFLFEEVRFPPSSKDHIAGLPTLREDLRSLFSRPLFLFAIFAQFASILALAMSWTLAEQFFPVGFPELSAHDLANVFIWCVVLFGLGRMAATAMMLAVEPALVLALFSAGGVLAALVAAGVGGAAAAFAAVALGFFLGPSWPTILGLAINGLGSRMKLATAFITMGGALGAVTAHFLADLPPQTAMAVPAASAGIILLYALVAKYRARAL